MKKILSILVVAGGLVSASAFAQNEHVYYPANNDYPTGQVVHKTRAEVRAELVKAEKSGELKRLDSTVYQGN